MIIAEAALEAPEMRALRAAVPAVSTLAVAEAAWGEFGQLPAAVGVLAVVPTPRLEFGRAGDFCLCSRTCRIRQRRLDSCAAPLLPASGKRSLLASVCAFQLRSPKVLRAGQGAHFNLEIFEGVWTSGNGRDVMLAAVS